MQQWLHQQNIRKVKEGQSSSHEYMQQSNAEEFVYISLYINSTIEERIRDVSARLSETVNIWPW